MSSQRPGPQKNVPRQGAALLLAMLILTLVATLTAGMVWQQSRAIAVEAAERARTQGAWIITGLLDWARLILREDQRTQERSGRSFDSLDEPWATPLAEARLSTFLAADKDNNADSGPEAFFAGGITDAQSRWNLRNLLDDGTRQVLPAEVAVLAQLCQLAGLPTETAQRIASGLQAAWGVPGNAPGNDSATADTPLPPQRLTDLVWLGIDAATVQRLAPWVDLLPVRTTVNANTAPREVLMASIPTLDAGSAERLVQQRQRKPFETREDVKRQLPEGKEFDLARIGVGSVFFEAYGRLRLEDRVLEERSLLERRQNEVVTVRRERINLNTLAR